MCRVSKKPHDNSFTLSCQFETGGASVGLSDRDKFGGIFATGKSVTVLTAFIISMLECSIRVSTSNHGGFRRPRMVRLRRFVRP